MPRTRLTAEERTAQLISAAVTAFSRGGYAGTTTDQVARLAGVSQPYVIRIFRTKQELFLSTVRYSCDQIEQRFRAAAEHEATLASLGEAYDGMLADRELVTLLLHGFAASAEPEIGVAMRQGFGRIYDTIRELTGCTPRQAGEFFAVGMLLTCMGAMRAIGPGVEPEPWARALLESLDDDMLPEKDA